jgi:ABC-type microcin C transport system permease subunit YejB
MGFFLRRLGYTVFVLWAVASILFFMFRLMPGDPRTAFIDNTFTAEQQQLLLEQFGLDQPLHVQYGLFMANLVQGDLGQSFRFKRPVLEMILEVFPNSIVSPAQPFWHNDSVQPMITGEDVAKEELAKGGYEVVDGRLHYPDSGTEQYAE